MVDTRMDILGLRELQHDFERLSRSLQRKVAREAAMAGVRVARDAARAAAPKDTGRLERNIIARSVRQSETPGGATAGVAVRGINNSGTSDRSMKTDDPKNAFYWRFVELGTSTAAANPFIRRSWDGSLREIEGAVQTRLAAGIDKAITGG